ncbi:MAG: hypothetical protein Q9185_000495 [Variospora sp. 1 TL-2023]
MSSNHHLLLLLLHRILAFRPETSPFTLVLDSVEQGAAGFVREIVRGVKASSKTQIIYVSYASNKPPPGVDAFILARRKTPEAVRQEISSACSCSSSSSNSTTERTTLLILSPLSPLLQTSSSLPISTYLLSLLTPTTSLLGIHHTDIPLPSPSQTKNLHHHHYHPSPLTLLTYLATTILTLHSLPQSLARRRAENRSLPPPRFGLADEENEGVVVGMGANAYESVGMVLEMEYRRKSGRGVVGGGRFFFVPPPPSSLSSSIPQQPGFVVGGGGGGSSGGKAVAFEGVKLLHEYPGFGKPRAAVAVDGIGEKEKEEEEEEERGTFELGLTQKQREARERVVLPYFDAQGRDGGGEGGRILYQMGREDDFDEEEDEV